MFAKAFLFDFVLSVHLQQAGVSLQEAAVTQRFSRYQAENALSFSKVKQVYIE